MSLNKLKKNTELVTKTVYVRDVVKIKKKFLDTKPTDEMKELIGLERELDMEFSIKKADEKNFDKIKSKLPCKIQDFISDPDKAVEINNYYALAETIKDFRLSAKYLMAEVRQAKETMDVFGGMTLDQHKWYSKSRAKINKKSPPKHKMFRFSGTQWLKHSPHSQEKRNLEIPKFYSTLAFDADFECVETSTYLMGVLKGIDVRRLRICENGKCSHVFWAYRLNQDYCGEVCQKRAKRSRSYKLNKKKGAE